MLTLTEKSEEPKSLLGEAISMSTGWPPQDVGESKDVPIFISASAYQHFFAISAYRQNTNIVTSFGLEKKYSCFR